MSKEIGFTVVDDSLRGPLMPVDSKKNIATKLSAIMGALGNIEKKGFNSNQKYKFVRESDVVDALAPMLAEKSLYLHQTVESCAMEPLYKTSSGSMMFLTTVHVAFQWYDGETGEMMPPATFVGTGADTGDKGVYKAMTGAEKYFLMKTFLISTGDDPEADEKVDRAAAAGEAASAPIIKRGTSADVGKGGKTDLATPAQVKEVFRLAALNKLSGADIAALANRLVPEGSRHLLLRNDSTAAKRKEALIAFLESQKAAVVSNIILALQEMSVVQSGFGDDTDDKPTDTVVDVAETGLFDDAE